MRLDARKVIRLTLLWSKATVPLIALLASLASAVRTVQTIAEIYTKAGSHPIGIGIAVLAFTAAAEGALFFLALAQEDQHIRWRQQHRKRYVTSLRTIGRSIGVRVGIREPLTYDQMPQSDGALNTLIMVAFLLTVASNLYQGFKPLTEQLGDMSIQEFSIRILNENANLQLTFLVDLAAALFPPFMAWKAGHLAARFAAEGTLIQHRSEQKPVERVQPRSTAIQASASERLIEWLNEHPEDLKISQSSLAKKTGVSVGTVNSVLKRHVRVGVEQ